GPLLGIGMGARRRCHGLRRTPAARRGGGCAGGVLGRRLWRGHAVVDRLFRRALVGNRRQGQRESAGLVAHAMAFAWASGCWRWVRSICKGVSDTQPLATA